MKEDDPSLPEADEEDSTLPTWDVQAIVRLLGRVAALNSSHQAKKRMLMDGLCEIVDANGWLWTMTRIDPRKGEPISLGILHGGLSDGQVVGWIQMNHHRSRRPPDHPAFAAEVKKGRHFTRSRDQLVSDEVWYSHENVRRYRIDQGIDHSMHSIFPLEEPGVFSGVELYRFVGNPAFSSRDRRLTHIVLSEVDWLHRADFPANRGAGVDQLSHRQREVLILLLEGRHRADIAELLRISPHTVNDHIKAIYRHFKVTSQIALIRRFREGDGNDLPPLDPSGLWGRACPLP